MLRRSALRRRSFRRGLSGPPGRWWLAVALLLLLAGCGDPAPTPGSPLEPALPRDAHDPQTDRVKAALAEQLGVTFEPAGPHHELGRGLAGIELDLVGVPVQEVVLSLPADDPEAGLAYLPHLRDLLHGPDRVYDWVAAMLACRTDAERACEDAFEQGSVEARFSDGGPGYVVVTLRRLP